LENRSATAKLLGAALVSTLVMVPVLIPIARRVGKTRAWVGSLLLKTTVFAGFYMAGPDNLSLVYGLAVVYGCAAACGAVLGPSIKSDVVDLDEAETGMRREGTFFAAWNLVLKSAIALAMALCGFVLASSGFEPNAVQSASAVAGIKGLMSVIPLVFHVIATGLLLRLGLSDVEHRHARIQAVAVASASRSMRHPI
jgi:GPH family glycoside/pentoside/hexuronide:cation symporter